jgi:hypothetical protein
MKHVRTALGIAAVVGMLAGYIARDIEEYIRSPFFGDKHEVTYSSRSPRFTSTMRIKLDKQPDSKTTTLLGAIHGAHSDLLADIANRELNDTQRSTICLTFDAYQRIILEELNKTNLPKRQIEIEPIPIFKSYPVFARR